MPDALAEGPSGGLTAEAHSSGLAADEDAAMAGGPEAALGMDDLFALRGDVAQHRVDAPGAPDEPGTAGWEVFPPPSGATQST